MKLTTCLLTLLLLSPLSQAAEPDWQTYQQLLDRHLSPKTQEGIRLNALDYPALIADPAFDEIVGRLESYPLESLTAPKEQLAFYINAYNIFAIKMIKDHWPLDSIRDAGSWFSPVWKKKIGTLGGKTTTLHDIEHEILRKMGEPRIHFAIVCASLSCPDLRGEPYRAAQLEQQLEQQVQSFLDNPGKGLRQSGDGIQISKIFDWFDEDFDSYQGVSGFIRQYRPQLATKINGYLDYNWQLNGQ